MRNIEEVCLQIAQQITEDRFPQLLVPRKAEWSVADIG